MEPSVTHYTLLSAVCLGGLMMITRPASVAVADATVSLFPRPKDVVWMP